jgi:hypothetical protein
VKTKSKVAHKKKPTFKDAQNYLRAFFRDARNSEVRLLWDVLSALRGPDYEGSEDKDATTVVIREAFLGPKTKVFPADFAVDSAERAERRKDMVAGDVPLPEISESYHFYTHARNAFDALGLKWDEVNPPAK